MPPKPKVGKGGAGLAIYETYCSGCHTAGAGGAPKYGDVSSWTPILKPGIVNVYAHAIKGIGGMPAKGTCLSCSDDDIKQAVNYMVAAVTGEAAKNSVAIPPQKKLTMADGERLYEKNCSVCHNTGFKHAPKPGDVLAWKPIVDAGFVNAYINIVTGKNGHPTKGACPNCTDAELKAALKYMMQKSAPNENYSLW